MKKIALLILVSILLLGCSENQICFDSPEPPYGKPDYESRMNMVGIEMRTYIYECYNGNYIEIQWTRQNGFCWEESKFISEPCNLR